MSLDAPRATSPLVETVDQLVDVFRRAEKPPERWKVGVEHEKIAVLAGTVDPVPYEGRQGIGEVLRRFRRWGYEPVVEDGHAIALQGPGRTISLEPGGQFELSGRAFDCAHSCRRELLNHIARTRAVARELGLRFLAVGYRPFGTPADARWMPKARYAPMRAYLPTRGRLAADMMTMTATVQANFDWSDEDDVRRKMRTAMGVSPIVAAIFANSFLVRGEDSGFASYRYEVWRDVDGDRCGLLPFVFDDDFSYRRYVEWSLDVPIIFLRREGKYLPGNGVTFRRFWREGLHGHRATVGDYLDHLTTLFPEVRLKNVLEVRGADAGDPEMNAALPALWKGILYDENACAEAWKLVSRESFAERLDLQRDVARVGLRAEVGGRKVLDLARELLGIAAAGLVGSHCLDPAGRDERAVLEPLRPLLASGRAPADVWRERWHGELGRDPAKFVEAIAY